MAALGRLDELEEFLLALQPEEVFRPRRALAAPGRPATTRSRDDREPPRRRARARRGPRAGGDRARRVRDRPHESRRRGRDAPLRAHVFVAFGPPETMGRAILASAAISALVLPVAVDGVIATGGGWVSFPLERVPQSRGRRDRRLQVHRELPPDRRRVPRSATRPARAVPGRSPVRALLAEVRLAEQRAERGEPAHYAELIVRLMRVAIARGGARGAARRRREARSRRFSAFGRRRFGRGSRGAAWRRKRLRARARAIFASARSRSATTGVPTLIVRGTPARRASIRHSRASPGRRRASEGSSSAATA